MEPKLSNEVKLGILNFVTSDRWADNNKLMDSIEKSVKFSSRGKIIQKENLKGFNDEKDLN